jgi:chaperone required for assembly of F1-ATPase
MREFLDDAHQHRDDGYGRAQAHAKRQLPKRFYKETGVAVVDGGFAVTLDGKPAKTPGLKPMIVPSAGIATAMAEEWGAQEAVIDPQTMPLVRLVNSAVESGEATIGALRDEIVKYAGNDLLLYRVDTPARLVQQQEEHWDRALVRLARHFGVSFQPTIGIIHQPQPKPTLDRLSASLDEEGLFVLTTLNSITSLTGSGLLALALWNRLLGTDEVWEAASVDEDYNIEMWGMVEEIATRRDKRRREFDAAVKLLELLRED